MASWYGAPYHNRRAANGEVYDMNSMTAAHLTLPLGSWVEVTSRATGRKLRLRVNDRGPYVNKFVIDLSQAAAKRIDMLRAGVVRVELRVVDGP